MNARWLSLAVAVGAFTCSQQLTATKLAGLAMCVGGGSLVIAR